MRMEKAKIENAKEKIYIAIDLKSFYASVECVERGRDALTTNLVVADASRTEKTICLAVSPSLKEYGIPGRARLFEVVAKVKQVNAQRRNAIKEHSFTGSSDDSIALKKNKKLALDYIVAKPRMALYMQYSTRIYQIYLKYISEEDMHVYSVDEVFLDVTDYLKAYEMTARQLTQKIIQDIYDTTGITATAGIGSNLYLCKIAMDIMAKHEKPDKNGVRIAELDELTYRKNLWSHTPITDFWRVGRGYARKLERCGIFTMGDIARCSIGKDGDFYNEELLYKMFGVNAELLIDHAWGYEPCTIAEIKSYTPENNSLGSGQVLKSPYPYEKAKLIVREMTELLVLDLVEKRLATNQMVLTVGYDIENLKDKENAYQGEITTDRYGRKIPKHAHGTANLGLYTTSTQKIIAAVMELFDRIIDPTLFVRRVTLTANHVIAESKVQKEQEFEQLDLFSMLQEKEQNEKEKEQLEKERKMQEAIIELKHKFGKNAILKGMNLQEGGTTIERNGQIGGHKA